MLSIKHRVNMQSLLGSQVECITTELRTNLMVWVQEELEEVVIPASLRPAATAGTASRVAATTAAPMMARVVRVMLKSRRCLQHRRLSELEVARVSLWWSSR